MKTKILIALLVVAIITLGVLLGMKVAGKKEAPLNVGEEKEDPLTVVLEDEKKEESKSKYDGDKRTLAVVIDNVGDAIPQTSLNEAMLVYEIIVEGGLTRFLAIYKDPRSRNNRASKVCKTIFHRLCIRK